MTDAIPVSLEEERKRRREGLSLLTTVPAPRCYPCCAYVVNGKVRTVTCKKCGRLVDAFDAMMELALSFEGYAKNRDTLQLESARLRAEIGLLEKRVESLKGMERRLLRDATVIAARIADHIGAMPVKETYKPVMAWVARIVRDGHWEGVSR